jgi:hypothetical protein
MTLNEIKKRYAGVQNYIENIGSGGCLFLALCTIIEEVTGKPADLVGIVQKSLAKDWLQSDFEVKDSLSILDEFTGKRWKRTVVSKLPTQIKDNEFTIEKWFNPRTEFTHFKRRFVDTLISSVTVKEGYIKEYYIYYYKV